MRTHHLQQWKSEGHKWPMLTAYDSSTARVFDEAGIPVLLVGDSAANVVYGYDTTVPVTIDELIPLSRRRARHAARAGRGRPAVRQLPGGPQAGAAPRDPVHEGGRCPRRQVRGRRARRRRSPDADRRPASRSWPISASPRSAVNALGGYRVQGRGDAAEQPVHDAMAVAEAGAFAVVLEMVPAELATASPAS